jgi:hypothetical protein
MQANSKTQKTPMLIVILANCDTKHKLLKGIGILMFCEMLNRSVDVPEWLSGMTRNHVGFARAGSNPAVHAFFFFSNIFSFSPLPAQVRILPSTPFSSFPIFFPFFPYIFIISSLTCVFDGTSQHLSF